MRKQSDPSYFQAGIARLKPVMDAHGFSLEVGDTGVSSGGWFTNCSFRRGKLEIGLIVRSGNELGCPNYSEGRGYVGHEGLIMQLGGLEDISLVPGEYLSYRAKNGGDAFDALYTDMTQIILPELQKSEEKFSIAIARAYRLR